MFPASLGRRLHSSTIRQVSCLFRCSLPCLNGPIVRHHQHQSTPTKIVRESVPPFAVGPFIRINSETEAHEIVVYLKQDERETLYKVLGEHLGIAKSEELAPGGDEKRPLTREQMKALFLCNALPFVGFGILDNLLMIVAGEYIDNTMGVVLGLSTMAAAGLGNILSDIAGIGSAHYVEFMVAKFLGVKPPPLTASQWDSGAVRWTTNTGRCLGLVIGCFIGMFPLLFFDETEKQKQKLEAKKAT